MKHKRSKTKKIHKPEVNKFFPLWSSKGFVIFLLAVLVFMSISVSKEVLRRFETQYEIDKLESEVARLNTRNVEIGDAIAMLNTSSTQDKEARVKLGLQAKDENVVMLPGRRTDTAMVLPDSDTISYIPIRDYESNPEKWFHYFWDKIDNS